jgi:hypothetical protein
MNYFNLLHKLEILYDVNIGGKFTPVQITRLIAKNVPYRDVVFSTNLTVNSAVDTITVSGLYDYGDDQWGLCPIEIELAYFKRKRHFVIGASMSRKIWNQLCFDVASVLGHEYVHLHQYRDRDYRPGRGFRSRENNESLKQTQEYLGHTDEIDAYSFTIAAEMAMGLRSGKAIDLKETVMYNNYCDAFGIDHSIITKLKNKSLKYYSILEGQYNEQSNRTNQRARCI